MAAGAATGDELVVVVVILSCEAVDGDKSQDELSQVVGIMMIVA